MTLTYLPVPSAATLSTRQLVLDVGSFQLLTAGPENGPLVVVAHGFPDLPLSFAPLIIELADRGLRVVAPWLRGYAPSTLAGPYDPDTLAADVVGLAAALAPGQRFHIVGHDWGAILAYGAAANFPETMASATVMSVPHPLVFLRSLLRPGQMMRSWYMFLFQLPGAGRIAAARDFALIDRLWRAWSPGLTLDADLRDEIHQCLRASWPAPLLYYRALTQPPGAAVARLRGPISKPLRVPLQYLHGAEDGCIAPDAGHGTERWAAGPYRAEIVPGAGHFLAIEHPRLIAECIAAWIAAHPA